ncbi:TIGR00730 family Rossman fold protein [Elusimicrobiota bacterium]
MKKICVFCGSSSGNNSKYKNIAKDLGTLLAKNNFGLVFGGGKVGIMGVLAASVMSGGGEVIGVIPEKLCTDALVKRDVTKLYVVKDMHERKAKMADLSDAFIALPGGIGTLEEFAEAVTWNQLDIHKKPCSLLNIEGYFNHFISFLGHMVKENFFSESEKSLIVVEKEPGILIKRLKEKLDA